MAVGGWELPEIVGLCEIENRENAKWDIILHATKKSKLQDHTSENLPIIEGLTLRYSTNLIASSL